MLHGLIELPWWGYVLVALVYTHITIVAVTIFLHRHQAHRALELHPVVSHFFRLWLWLTTGMNTREWTAVHRKHHAAVETEEDPHSPLVHGIDKVLWQGAELYRANSRNPEMLAQYGFGTPDDWLERHVYGTHPNIGVTLMFAAAVYIPLSDATAISFLNPVFAMIFAIPFLGERVGKWRWIAAAISITGAIILLRPGADDAYLRWLAKVPREDQYTSAVVFAELCAAAAHPLGIVLDR